MVENKMSTSLQLYETHVIYLTPLDFFFIYL
jgi:hypothetical protein